MGSQAATVPLVEEHVGIACPDGVQAWDIDPYGDDVLANLEAYYAGLRARGGFVWLSRYQMLACGRYAETREVFSDWKRFVSSRGVGLTDFKLARPWRPPSIILEVDPPDHAKTRTVMSRVMSPPAVAGLKAGFQAAADRLVDDLLAKGTFEAVTDLAEAYPTAVFPQAVGLTEVDARRLIDYGAMVFNALGPDNALRRKAMSRGPDVVPWILEQCKRARLAPGGFGASIYAAADRGEITEDEAGMLVRSLLSAGVDTTVTGIGNAIWCLARNPGEFERLKANPRLALPAFEEVLRYTSPVHSFCRTANQASEVNGVAIPQDAKILCVLGAANLDPDQWPDAGRFDITRRPTGHLAFGVGIHGCVGQIVARAEAEALLSAVARKVGSLTLAGEPVWRPGHAIHALDSLPVTIGAR
jgi:cytochrome P450